MSIGQPDRMVNTELKQFHLILWWLYVRLICYTLLRAFTRSSLLEREFFHKSRSPLQQWQFRKKAYRHLKLFGARQGRLRHVPPISSVAVDGKYLSAGRGWLSVDFQRSHGSTQHVEMNAQAVRSRQPRRHENCSVTLYTGLRCLGVNIEACGIKNSEIVVVCNALDYMSEKITSLRLAKRRSIYPFWPAVHIKERLFAISQKFVSALTCIRVNLTENT